MDDNTVKPYYLSLGKKLVKDLDGLDLLRNLSPEHHQLMAEYIGETIQDEVEYALRSHERSMARRARLSWNLNPQEPLYTGDNLIVPSAPTVSDSGGSLYRAVCRCADNRHCPVHDAVIHYEEDTQDFDMMTPDGQAEFQRECEQGLWEIVNHPNFLELIHQSGGWRFNTVWGAGGTDPSIYGIMDVAERVLKGNHDDHR